MRRGHSQRMSAENFRRSRQRSLFQISSQSSRSMEPRGSSDSQLWQGTTFPPGVTAMLLRQAPQFGVVMPRERQKSSSTQPGEVKLISISFEKQYSTLSRRMPRTSSWVSCRLSDRGVAAFPVVMSPEQVT